MECGLVSVLKVMRIWDVAEERGRGRVEFGGKGARRRVLRSIA